MERWDLHLPLISNTAILSRTFLTTKKENEVYQINQPKHSLLISFFLYFNNLSMFFIFYLLNISLSTDQHLVNSRIKK